GATLCVAAVMSRRHVKLLPELLSATQSVRTCVPTRSVGTRGEGMQGNQIMKKKLLSAALALCSFCLCGESFGQTSYPMITHTTPVAVQRGKTTEVVVEGQMNFAGVYKALFEGNGITAEVVPTAAKPAAPVKTVKLKLTVAAAA